MERVLDAVGGVVRQGTTSARARKMQLDWAINLSYCAILYLVGVLSYDRAKMRYWKASDSVG
jgi:hypothetical protein